MRFDEDTRVDAGGATVVSDRWNALGGVPNGGYLLGVCLQALRRELPFPDPLVASASYLRPPAPGPAEVVVDVARTGRRLATGTARLVQDGREAVRATATFTDLAAATGRTETFAGPPELPPPQRCHAVGPIPGISITEQIEYRAPALPGWADGRPSGEPSAGFWMRFADGSDADTVAVAALVDGAAPAVMELGVAGSSTIELTVHVRARPAPGWLACRTATRHLVGGFHEEDFEIWDSAGALVAQSRQIAVAG
jgi:acyl-CoA thioesterase